MHGVRAGRPGVDVGLQRVSTGKRDRVDVGLARRPLDLDLLGREPYLTVLKDGTLFMTGHLLALGGPHRFRKSPNVGCYVVLQPRRQNSGQS